MVSLLYFSPIVIINSLLLFIADDEVNVNVLGEGITSSNSPFQNGDTSHVCTCSIFLTISCLPSAGRGIVAGCYFLENDYVENSMSLLLPTEDIKQSRQLLDYCYGSGDDSCSVLLLGSGSLYNSHPSKSIRYFRALYEDIKPVSQAISESLPYLNYSDVMFQTTRTHRRVAQLL